MTDVRPPSRANSVAAFTSSASRDSGGDDHAVAVLDEGGTHAPSVAGFVTGRLLGRGGSASVWLVTDSAGQRFALKVPHGTLGTDQHRDGEPGMREPGPSGRMPGRRARRAAVPSGAGASPDASPSSDEPGRLPAADRGPASQGAAQGSAEEDVLLQESRLLQHLRHEHLVRTYGLIETDQGPALLMELAVGGSLLQLVRSRGPLPIAEVVTTLVPVAQALGFLHEAGALHGDITPGNILFTHEGRPLLSDFGTGRLLGSEPRAIPGTPGFIDPSSTTAYDAGIDVFALAAVSWFALTGRVPGPTEQRPPLALIVPEVPDAMMHLIEDGLSASRERRPSAASFARTLLSTSSPSPVNLVPAVHPSVLPELLTRRSGSRSAEPTSRWGRLMARWEAGRRLIAVPSGDGATVRGPRSLHRPRRSRVRPSLQEMGLRPRGVATGRSVRDVRAGSGPAPGRRPERATEGPPRATDRRTAGGRADGGSRARRIVAVASGCTAIVLLIAGVGLTVGGLQVPDRIPVETAMQGGDAEAREPSEDVGSTPEETRAGTPTDQQSMTPGPEPVPAGDGTTEETAIRPEDPVAALQGLVDLRAAAFGVPDAEILRKVDVGGSPAMTADRASVDALAQAGTGLRDLSITVREARALTGSELPGDSVAASLPGIAGPPDDVEAVLVRASMQISSYTTVSSPAMGTGSEAEGETDINIGVEADVDEQILNSTDDTGEGSPELMAAGQQELVFVLWDTAEGWRIHSVVEPW